MASNTNHKGKYALITGGTSGIGFELARLCAADGFNIILVARSEERLDDARKELEQHGVKVITMIKDLFLPGTAEEIHFEVKNAGILVEILINNAGQGEHGKFADVPLQSHLELVQLNIASLVALTRLFLEDMLARGHGRILQLASVVSKTPAPEFSVYAASKAFVLSFAEALAQELEDSPVSVTALLPGRTDTDFFFKAHMKDTKEYQEHELADPLEVAKDGYEAMMKGEHRVISGMQNKVMVGMLNAMPDSVNAANMQKNMKPSGKPEKEKKKHPGHQASGKERATIGKLEGDRGRK